MAEALRGDEPPSDPRRRRDDQRPRRGGRPRSAQRRRAVAGRAGRPRLRGRLPLGQPPRVGRERRRGRRREPQGPAGGGRRAQRPGALGAPHRRRARPPAGARRLRLRALGSTEHRHPQAAGRHRGGATADDRRRDRLGPRRAAGRLLRLPRHLQVQRALRLGHQGGVDLPRRAVGGRAPRAARPGRRLLPDAGHPFGAGSDPGLLRARADHRHRGHPRRGRPLLLRLLPLRLRLRRRREPQLGAGAPAGRRPRPCAARRSAHHRRGRQRPAPRPRRGRDHLGARLRSGARLRRSRRR